MPQNHLVPEEKHNKMLYIIATRDVSQPLQFKLHMAMWLPNHAEAFVKGALPGVSMDDVFIIPVPLANLFSAVGSYFKFRNAPPPSRVKQLLYMQSSLGDVAKIDAALPDNATEAGPVLNPVAKLGNLLMMAVLYTDVWLKSDPIIELFSFLVGRGWTEADDTQYVDKNKTTTPIN